MNRDEELVQAVREETLVEVERMIDEWNNECEDYTIDGDKLFHICDLKDKLQKLKEKK